MLINLLPVACGAAFGALCRVLLTKWISEKWESLFPAATFLINILGSLFLGFLTALSLGMNLTLLLGVGFMGAFTTFSTFNMENLKLLRAKQYKYFFSYIGGSYLFGIAAVFAGLALGSMF